VSIDLSWNFSLKNISSQKISLTDEELSHEEKYSTFFSFDDYDYEQFLKDFSSAVWNKIIEDSE
jgi:hypothetical protein